MKRKTDATIQNAAATSFPHSLKTAKEIEGGLNGIISAERIEELAAAQYMPCWLIDGKRWFQLQDVKAWLAKNICVYQPGVEYPKVIRIPVGLRAATKAKQIPESLSRFTEKLCEKPQYSFPTCVYFLVKDRTVVYVGQSVNLELRISQHCLGGMKDFDTVLYLPVVKPQLATIESAFIDCLEPKYNRNKHGGLQYSDSGFRKEDLEEFMNQAEPGQTP